MRSNISIPQNYILILLGTSVEEYLQQMSHGAMGTDEQGKVPGQDKEEGGHDEDKGLAQNAGEQGAGMSVKDYLKGMNGEQDVGISVEDYLKQMEDNSNQGSDHADLTKERLVLFLAFGVVVGLAGGPEQIEH